MLSVIMAASAFTGALTAFAKSTDDGHDAALAANFMAWAETTDNQTAEAVLDWADQILKNANIAPIIFEGNYVVVNIQIHGYIDSIDGVIDLASQAQGLLDQYGGLLGGDVNNIKLEPLTKLSYTKEPRDAKGKNQIVSKCGKSYRAVNDAKTIVMALAKTIYWNSNDNTTPERTNKNVIGQFIKGNLSLGSILNGIVDVYGLIGGIGGLNMWSGYQSNLAYNIIAQLILTKTNWYTEAEVADYQSYLQGKGGTKWNFDTQLFDKLTQELMQKISVTMTYAREKDVDEEGNTVYKPTDSSKTRYKKIKAYLEKNGLAENDLNIAKASDALGYDVNLRYDYEDGMIYIFRYGTGVTRDADDNIVALKGEKKLNITNESKVYELIDEALNIAWFTVLKPTIQTLRVNDSMDYYKDHGGNFDNQYYYWLSEEGLLDDTNWLNNYTTEKFNAYAQAKYAEYGCADVEEFTAKVKKTLTYDRTVVDDPTYTWRDTDKSCNIVLDNGRKESILFGKLRYSPLADKVFGIQTGPINLYIMETGAPNLEAFIESYLEGNEYDNIIAALNDGLVAAVKDIFPDSKNIGLTTEAGVQNIARPALATCNTTNAKTIAGTLVSNVTKMFEYAANVTDENLLNPFYHNNSITDKLSCKNLTEANFEEAMIPLLISCVTIISETKQIHITDWDYAKDAEGVGFVALREYLSYSLPSKDYDALVTTKNGKYEATVDVNKDGEIDLYQDVILPMARDAVGYLLNSIVPCRDKDGNVWDVYKSNPATDQTTLFDILNSVICYYASTETFNEPSWNTTASKTYGKGVASLLGVVNPDGTCKVKMKNSLWQNIDAIANSVWPTIGVLQYGTASKAGQANSEQLIYKNVVESLLDIGRVNTASNEMGVTTILMQLITIFTAEPIMNKGIDILVYDYVVASLVNGIFGAKLTGQYYAKVIPTSTDMNSKTPFDTLVDQAILANWKGDQQKENGVICNLFSNIYTRLGGVTEVTNATQGAGAWQGAMFAVKAVSYFVDGFVPQLKDHQFNAATISVNEPSRSNITGGSALSPTTVVTVKNEATGLNRFYKDKNGNIVADDRYFVEIVSVLYDNEGAEVNLTLDNVAGKMVAPEETVKINVTGNNPSDTSLVTFNLKYNVYLGTAAYPKKTKLYENQEAKCFLQLNANGGWAGDALPGEYEVGEGEDKIIIKYPNNTNHYTKAQTSGSRKTVNIYKNLVIENNNVAAINNYGIESTTATVDYLFAADADGNAYAAVDAKTGDVLNVDRYDYKFDGGEWQVGDTTTINGVTVSKGYTYAEVETAIGTRKDVQTRTHIALSLDADKTNAVVKSVQKNGDSYETATVDPALIAGGYATASTPTHGITFADFKGSTSTINKWLKYDGTSSIKATNYAMNMKAVYNGAVYNLGSTNVVIADTNGAVDLQQKYEAHLKEMAPYQKTDYNDYDGKNSATHENLTAKFQEVVGQMSAPVTLENASMLVSTKDTVAAVSSTEDSTGDIAYAPLASSVALQGDIANTARAKNGYWYTDDTYRFPIYSHNLLTDADVTNGKDAVGQAVQKGGDGFYYLVNDVQYKYEWSNEGTYADYPYYGETETPAVRVEEKRDNDGNVTETINHPLYNRTQFEYYTTNSKKVSSADDWAYKMPITKEITKKNDGTHDYRGYYEKLEDALNYYVMVAKKNLVSKGANDVRDQIIIKRQNMSSVDYDVATYEKMVQIGRNGEALVSKTGDKDEETGLEIYTTSVSSVEINEAVRLFNKYYDLVIERGYEGAKLEAEVKHLIGTVATNATAKLIDGVATITVAGAATPDYGAIVDGKLVNAGTVVYSDETWSAYTAALANAINAVKDQAKVSELYEAKKAVVRAENALAEPLAATTYTLAGTVTEAVDGNGTAGTYGLANIAIYANGERIGTTQADGTFSVEVDLGVTEVTFKVANGFDRTITTDGQTSDDAMSVGVVAIDFNNDGKVNAIDVALGSKAKKIGADKLITGAQFKSIMKTGVKY